MFTLVFVMTAIFLTLGGVYPLCQVIVWLARERRRTSFKDYMRGI